MHTENHSNALERFLEPPDGPAAADLRAEFEASFTTELQRLEAGRSQLDGPRSESLLSALGAAKVQEWDLALAFVDAASHRTASGGTRRASLSPGTLRQRFHFVMAMGARTPDAR